MRDICGTSGCEGAGAVFEREARVDGVAVGRPVEAATVPRLAVEDDALDAETFERRAAVGTWDDFPVDVVAAGFAAASSQTRYAYTHIEAQTYY